MEIETKSPEALSLAETRDLCNGILNQVRKMIFGQEDLIEESFCTFLAGGHILITGAPGLAKTTLVRVISENMGLHFGRVQFTPDLLPSDITGSEILNIDSRTGERKFAFVKGPVFVNLLLADEINRASPRTQSAMLEAMQERQVTIGGQIHQLPEPFMVFATQNPLESEGTFPLPEAQLDRFLIHSLVDYPRKDAEFSILKAHAGNNLIGEISPEKSEATLDIEKIRFLMKKAKSLPCDDSILTLINDLIRSTRPEDNSCPEKLKPLIWCGAGPRAGIGLISASRAFALISQEETVRWNHVKRMAKPVLRHRIRLAASGVRRELNEDRLIDELIEKLEQKHRIA